MPASLTRLTLRYKLLERREVHVMDAAVELPPFLRYLSAAFCLFRVIRSLPFSLEDVVVTNSCMTSQLRAPDIACLFRHTSLRTLELPHNFTDQLPDVDWPELQDLKLGRSYNHPLRARDWPKLQALTLVSFGDSYSHSLDDLPPSLERLEMRCKFERPLDKLPSSLRVLELGEYNCPLNHLPVQLQELSIGFYFNQPLDALPSNLMHLDLLCSSFNGPLDHLPKALTVLYLPACFNRPLDSLPPSLKTLMSTASSQFNQPLNHLPDSLATLRLGGLFDQPFLRLPRGLTTLQLGDSFDHSLPLVAPASSLSPVHSSEHKLPATGSNANDCKSTSDLDFCLTWPSALRSLSLGKAYNQPLSLPSSLTSLKFPHDGAFSQALPAVLPKDLVDLRLPAGYSALYLDPAVSDGLSAMFC